MPDLEPPPSASAALLAGLIGRLEREIVGQRALLDRLIVALLAGGHVNIEPK